MRAIPVLAAALVAAGCASGPPTVMDADYGRLRPDQAAGVDSARTELSRAHDELAAASSQRGDAAREEKAARTERESAERDLDRAKKRVEAAEARTDYAGTLVEARKAAEAAAQQRVDLLSAKIEVLKLEALEQAKLQPSKPYDSKAFYGRVSDAQKKLEDAQEKTKKLERDANDGKRRWEDLQRKVPAAD
ncbi:MAG TPA: hypothetical protein VF841_13370 [Anaeromyxobacter sp.]